MQPIHERSTCKSQSLIVIHLSLLEFMLFCFIGMLCYIFLLSCFIFTFLFPLETCSNKIDRRLKNPNPVDCQGYAQLLSKECIHDILYFLRSEPSFFLTKVEALKHILASTDENIFEETWWSTVKKKVTNFYDSI